MQGMNRELGTCCGVQTGPFFLEGKRAQMYPREMPLGAARAVRETKAHIHFISRLFPGAHVRKVVEKETNLLRRKKFAA